MVVVSKDIPSTQQKQQLQQELAKAQGVRGLAIHALANLCQRVLDPDVNADFLELTDLLAHTKLSLVNKAAQCGILLSFLLLSTFL